MSTKVGADDFVASGRGLDLSEQPRAPLVRAQPVELHALLARNYPERPAIIAGGVVVRQGLTVLAGPPKKGKSFLILHQTFCRSLGLPWLGFATTPGVTVSLNAEIPEPRLQARIGIMKSAFATPVPRDTVHFVTDRQIRLDQRDGLRIVRGLLESLRPDFLQIDPLARFMSGEENSTRDMGRLVGALDDLIQTYQVAIEVVHHTGKPSGDDTREGGHRLRGSSALFAAADSVLILDRERKGGFKLNFELRHAEEPTPLLLQRAAHLCLEPAAPAGPPDELLQVARIVERLPLKYGRLVEAIRADLGVGERTAEGLVARARQAGLIEVDAHLYRTTANYRNENTAVQASLDV